MYNHNKIINLRLSHCFCLLLSSLCVGFHSLIKKLFRCWRKCSNVAKLKKIMHHHNYRQNYLFICTVAQYSQCFSHTSHKYSQNVLHNGYSSGLNNKNKYTSSHNHSQSKLKTSWLYSSRNTSHNVSVSLNKSHK